MHITVDIPSLLSLTQRTHRVYHCHPTWLKTIFTSAYHSVSQLVHNIMRDYKIFSGFLPTFTEASTDTVPTLFMDLFGKSTSFLPPLSDHEAFQRSI
jgi:hypothetical protein